jgi:hypothetical protein
MALSLLSGAGSMLIADAATVERPRPMATTRDANDLIMIFLLLVRTVRWGPTF